MTRNEKKTAIENMAERFMSISDLEGKSMAIVLAIIQGCRNSPEGVTSSAGKRKPFLFMPI